MRHYLNVFFGEPGQKASFTVQQGEYNSREVVCTLWQAGLNEREPLLTEGKYVMVVYRYGTAVTPEYDTTICGENKVSFTIPQCVVASSGKPELQLFVYEEGSLLKSATIPFKVLYSLHPSEIAIPDVEPAMIRILAQVDNALKAMEASEKERAEAEAQRKATFEEWEKRIAALDQAGGLVYNAETMYEFPSMGSASVIYKAEKERRLYQWNPDELKYELLNEGTSGESIHDIDIIYGGGANGTN